MTERIREIRSAFLLSIDAKPFWLQLRRFSMGFPVQFPRALWLLWARMSQPLKKPSRVCFGPCLVLLGAAFTKAPTDPSAKGLVPGHLLKRLFSCSSAFNLCIRGRCIAKSTESSVVQNREAVRAYQAKGGCSRRSTTVWCLSQLLLPIPEDIQK